MLPEETFIETMFDINADLLEEVGQLRYLAEAASTMGNDRLAESLSLRASNIDAAADRMLIAAKKEVNIQLAESNHHWRRVGDALLNGDNA